MAADRVRRSHGRVWDADTLDPFTRSKAIPATSISSASARTAAASSSASLEGARIWDAESGKLALRLEGHQAYLTSATFSPDGRLVLTTSDDRTARIWDAATGAPQKVLLGHQARAYAGPSVPTAAAS